MDFLNMKPKKENKASTISYEQFIEKENVCPLCGYTLYVVVELSLNTSSLKEDAHCPNCCIKTRTRSHKMH